MERATYLPGFYKEEVVWRKHLYEDMYGTSAPDTEEEGMTARELKDYIHERIDELSDGSNGSE